MTVKIVTDSTCDLSAERTGSLGVTVVPLTVFFGEEAFLDGVDLGADAFYERLERSETLPRTSQPSVAQFKEAYERLSSETEDIVSIHLSSRMSGTLNSASIAREDLPAGVHIDIVDSYNTSVGLGAVVVEAAEAALRGASRSEVVDVARKAVDRVHLYAAVDTLEYLRKGGRIGRASSFLGSLLSIKPIVHMEGGELAPLERVRTRAKALERLYELATADQTISRLYISAAADVAAAQALAERVRPRLPHTEIFVGDVGPIVGVHVGPRTVGIVTVARA
ncbi:MAG: DegV family protein [Dehalococcoidia bacterium]